MFHTQRLWGKREKQTGSKPSGRVVIYKTQNKENQIGVEQLFVICCAFAKGREPRIGKGRGLGKAAMVPKKLDWPLGLSYRRSGPRISDAYVGPS